VAIGVVFFSIMQFRDVFWKAGLFEAALIAVGAQAVYAWSRVTLHGWYCELAVRVQLGANSKNQLERVHNAMLGRLRQEHPRAMKYWPPFWKRALLGFFLWTVVTTIIAFLGFTLGLHREQFWAFLQGVLPGSWQM
jgi:hypothetical protein